MTSQAIARVPAPHASRYLQQLCKLCKHWAHNLTVEFTPEHGRIAFPKSMRGMEWPEEGVVTLTAEPDALVCVIEASANEQRDGLKGALERHIDRFPFREAPLQYEWRDR